MFSPLPVWGHGNRVEPKKQLQSFGMYFLQIFRSMGMLSSDIFMLKKLYFKLISYYLRLFNTFFVKSLLFVPVWVGLLCIRLTFCRYLTFNDFLILCTN